MRGFRHLDAGGLTPGEQRRILKLAVAFGFAALLLGAAGLFWDDSFAASWESAGGFSAITGLMFDTVGLLTLNEPSPAPENWAFALARISALCFAVLAGFTVLSALAGTVVDAGRLAYLQTRQAWKGGGHVVILGIGRLGVQLIKDLRPPRPAGWFQAIRVLLSMRRPVVAVEITEDNPRIGSARARGALVIEGDATDSVIRAEALIHQAHEIFIVTGDDAVNLQIAGELIRDRMGDGSDGSSRASDRRRPKTEATRIYVHVGEPEFSQDLAGRGVFGGLGKAARVSVFNLWETAARNLIAHDEWGLGTRYAPGDDLAPYYIVFGFGEMGRTMTLELARLAHFGGFKRPRLTICDDFGDPALALHREAFRTRHPHFSPRMSLGEHVELDDASKDSWSYHHPSVQRAGPNSVDYAVHAEFLPMAGHRLGNDLIDDLLDRVNADRAAHPSPAVIICFADERQNVRSAFQLERLFNQADLQIPIFVYLPSEQGLQDVLGQESGASFRSFGDLAETAGYDVVVQPRLEQVAVGADWAYDVAISDTMSFEEKCRTVAKPPLDSDWDEYEESFEASPPWARAANLGVAAHAVIKMGRLGCRIPSGAPGWTRSINHDDVETLARMEHNRWMAQKLIDGFSWEDYPRGYWGLSTEERKAKRNEMANRRKRATLVPWGELHRQDQEKDILQVLALPSILRRAGLRPEKVEDPAIHRGYPASPEVARP